MVEEPVNVGRYQIMPDMSPEQYQELKEDIRKRGVLAPIEFDEQGQIIDGHHRFRAFSELIEEGADVPLYDKVVRKFASEQEKYEYVISFNVKRRHLTPEQRRDLAVKLRKPPYSYTLTRVAELLGVSAKTIWYDLDSLSQQEKQELEAATKVITSSDGKIRPTSYAPRLFVTGQTQLRTMQMDLINEAAKRIQAQGYEVETTEEALVIHSNGDAKGATLQAISQAIPTSEENVQEAAASEDKESIVREVLTQLTNEEASLRYSAFAWYGGKGAHLNWLMPLLPPAKHFVDVFGGSAAVIMNRNPASPLETYNDLDSNLCLAPDTRLLRADLTWIHAGDVAVGDELVGFDEHNEGQREGLQAPEQYRRFCKTSVTAVERLIKPCYRLTFEDGTTVVASSDHMWLSGSIHNGWKWRRTDSFVDNRSTQKSRVMKVCDVVEKEDSYDAGWLSGFLDGEGSLKPFPGWQINVSQKAGEESDKAVYLLTERGFRVSTASHKYVYRQQQTDRNTSMETHSVLGGMHETLRLLMLARPERLIRNLIPQLPYLSLYGRSRHTVAVVKKEFLGNCNVVAIQTTSHTFIAEGLASHNCNFFRVLRDDTDALLRAVCLTPFSREERRHAYRELSKCDNKIERARMFFVLARQSRSGIAQRQSGGDLNSWKFVRDNIARGMASSVSQWKTGIDGLAAVASRFSRIQIENYPALRVIELYDSQDTLFYCDPPYLHDTRVQGHDATYEQEMTREAHVELAHALNKIKGRAAVSGYPSDLYDDLYKNWHRVDMPTTMTVNAGDTDKQRIECLWTNYRTL